MLNLAHIPNVGVTQVSELIDLQEHCYRLSFLIAELPGRSRRNLSWLSAADWLNTAAGIRKVEIDTSRFDETVLWCGPAWDYESKRSKLLTQVGTQLTVFNFVWGGFETVIKVINPPCVPGYVKRRRTIIDDALFYLKNEYEPTPRVALYDDTLAELRLILKEHPHYDLDNEFKEHSFSGMSGLGAHIVRIIRNDFAHGSARLPIPHDWGSDRMLVSEQPYTELIRTSSRILLLTAQMLLLAHLKDEEIRICNLRDSDGEYYNTSVQTALRILHLDIHSPNQGQLPLFEEDLEYG